MKICPYQILSTREGVMRSLKLPICLLDEMKTGFKIQGVINFKKIIINNRHNSNKYICNTLQ